jgi:hypothetical protein
MFRNSILLLDTVVVVTAQVRLVLLLVGCGTGCSGGGGNSGGTGTLRGRVSSLSLSICLLLLLFFSSSYFLFAVRYGCCGHRYHGEWYAGSVVLGWTLAFFHDDVMTTTTAGSYSVLYYYAGCCVNPLTTVDAGDRLCYRTCGVRNNNISPKKLINHVRKHCWMIHQQDFSLLLERN